MPALPVAQLVATDSACSVHLPSLPLSIKQTGALKIELLLESTKFLHLNIL